MNSVFLNKWSMQAYRAYWNNCNTCTTALLTAELCLHDNLNGSCAIFHYLNISQMESCELVHLNAFWEAQGFTLRGPRHGCDYVCVQPRHIRLHMFHSRGAAFKRTPQIPRESSLMLRLGGERGVRECSKRRTFCSQRKGNVSGFVRQCRAVR